MQQQHNHFQQNMNHMGTSMAASFSKNHSAHELLDTHALLSGIVSTLNEYLMCEQYIKDPELKNILQRQRQFITDQYNITVESLKTGQDPSHPTGTYEMKISNEVQYGLTPSQPTTPNQDLSQLGDKCLSGIMMSCMKSLAGTMTIAASECTNPVVRRILQDSIPNYLEMATNCFYTKTTKAFIKSPNFQIRTCKLRRIPSLLQREQERSNKAGNMFQ